jgi:MFS transporter, OFA family, oxalate/formate antiporter
VQRYLILISAVVMQMCLGATYSWSVYVMPLRELTGLLQGPVQMPFTFFYFAFPATMILSGSLLPRLGPRFCAMMGGLLFGSGWLLASQGDLHFSYTVLGIGPLAGVGAGFAYIVPIATCIQWFPRHKGLVTGIAVAGFGGGAALVTQVAGFLMTAQQFTPFQTFAVLGAGFMVLTVAGGSCMKYPPGANQRRARPLPVRDIILQPDFKALYLAMFSGLAAGFTINANLKELFPAGSLEAGIAAVSCFAVANAAGRIGWGWLFDHFNAQKAIRTNLLLQALLLFFSPLLLTTNFGLLGFALATGFNYGGVLVLYAATIARTRGDQTVGQVYGWLFSANIPAAIFPIAAGMIYDRVGSFTWPLIAIGVVIVVTSFFVRTPR